uniref:Zn(2)-C6 fungal-type domain-containing protein n=1 Tax=Mycena chlorophos TaxID=658473 RepID=A0ABQ0LSI5_MYCCL|nr:predicted protein [Mycena chlorophos]
MSEMPSPPPARRGPSAFPRPLDATLIASCAHPILTLALDRVAKRNCIPSPTEPTTRCLRCSKKDLPCDFVPTAETTPRYTPVSGASTSGYHALGRNATWPPSPPPPAPTLPYTHSPARHTRPRYGPDSPYPDLSLHESTISADAHGHGQAYSASSSPGALYRGMPMASPPESPHTPSYGSASSPGSVPIPIPRISRRHQSGMPRTFVAPVEEHGHERNHSGSASGSGGSDTGSDPDRGWMSWGGGW